MKTVLYLISKLTFGTGILGAVILTCMLDSSDAVLIYILMMYIVAAALMAVGVLLSRLMITETTEDDDNAPDYWYTINRTGTGDDCRDVKTSGLPA
ncbi:MAG: hypothetical protein Q4E54_07270 [Lachnospiraceae bacterium]|nr:hypothetical protein [Lachnospiraceae bacterium]